MSFRVVLFTRSSRPSGAQMARRLCESGLTPIAVIVESRGRMMRSKVRAPLRLGIPFLFKKIWETIRIQAHFYARKFLRGGFKSPDYLSIQELAIDYPIRLIFVEDHNSPETVKILRELNPDIGVLTNTRRVQKEILSIPRHGFLNLHSSLLPKYAGLESIFWALYHGEKEIGVTVHFAAEKIDGGDMVLQKKISVGPLDNPDTLSEKARWLGTALMVRAIRQIQQGMDKRIPQNREKGSYFSWPTAEERRSFKKYWHLFGSSRFNPPRLLEELEQEQRQIRQKDFSIRPRVLQVITRLIRGGAQENTLATALGLREKGYEVTLLTGPSWGKEGEILSEALEQGLDVILVQELVREISPIQDVFAYWKLFRIMRRSNFDIVHTHTSKAGLLGRWAAHLAKIPIVVHTPHGHVFHSYFSAWKEKLFISLEKAAAKISDRLIALTSLCRDEHLELGIGAAEQWKVIPSGVNEEKFQNLSEIFKNKFRNHLGISSEKKIIGFVGRLAPVKGPRYFIEAIPQIFSSFPQTHFLIVGDGEERSWLEKKVREYGLDSHVTFLGHLENVADALSIVDILAVPSLNEGMGRVIVEAGLLARPVVATRTGGIPDLIEDGTNGLLVEPRNSGEIARAVARLLEHPKEAARLGTNLKEKMLGGFTEKHMVEKVDELYQKLMRDKDIFPYEFEKKLWYDTPPIER